MSKTKELSRYETFGLGIFVGWMLFAVTVMAHKILQFLGVLW